MNLHIFIMHVVLVLSSNAGVTNVRPYHASTGSSSVVLTGEYLGKDACEAAVDWIKRGVTGTTTAAVLTTCTPKGGASK